VTLHYVADFIAQTRGSALTFFHNRRAILPVDGSTELEENARAS